MSLIFCAFCFFVYFLFSSADLPASAAARTCPESITTPAALTLATYDNNLFEVNCLFALEAAGQDLDVDYIDGTSNSALIISAWQGFPDIAYVLLAHGANTNIRGYKGKTALQQAAKYGHTSIVNAILLNGTDVDLKSEVGWTALMQSCYEDEREDVFDLLMQKELNLDIQNNEGWTALMIAAGRHCLRINPMHLTTHPCLLQKKDVCTK